MDYGEIIDTLAAYRRPGTPSFERHYQRLPATLTTAEHASILSEILNDEALPAKVREHAAGALGEVGDHGHVPELMRALQDRRLRRGAAVALGRLGDRRAATALRPWADAGLGAARWALLQVAPPEDVDDVLTRLREGHLRHIRPTIAALSGERRDAVAAAVSASLGDALDRKTVTYDEHVWMVTALQYLPGGESTLLRVLPFCADGLAVDLCHRTLRAVSAATPLDAIEPLVELIRSLARPAHVHQAAVCLRKISKRHGPAAEARLRRLAADLRRAQRRWQTALSHTPATEPARPWDHRAGTPGWQAEIERALKALQNLLHSVPAPEPGGDHKLP
jgi:hypothetical protein